MELIYETTDKQKEKFQDELHDKILKDFNRDLSKGSECLYAGSENVINLTKHFCKVV